MNQKKHYNFLLIFVFVIILILIGYALLYVFQQVQTGTSNALTQPQKANGWARLLNGVLQHFFKKY